MAFLGKEWPSSAHCWSIGVTDSLGPSLIRSRPSLPAAIGLLSVLESAESPRKPSETEEISDAGVSFSKGSFHESFAHSLMPGVTVTSY